MNFQINSYLKYPKNDISPIFITVTYGGKRYRIYPGISISPKNWNSAKQEPKTNDQFTEQEKETVEKRLTTFKEYIKQTISYFNNEPEPPEAIDFKYKIQELKTQKRIEFKFLTDWIEDYIPRCGKSEKTKKNYQVSLNHLQRYEKQRKKRLRFKDIDLVFYKDFTTYFQELGYSLNFLHGNIFKHVKAWMNESEEEIHHGQTGHKNPKFKVLSETADTIYLTEQELLRIHELTIIWEHVLDAYPDTQDKTYSKRIKEMTAAKNRFLIGAFTALRVSDFNRLREFNVNDKFIHIKPKKGTKKNSDVIIPVHPVIREILKSGFDFNYKVYEQDLNEHIKHIGRLAGIKGQETVSITTAGGKLKSETFNRYELITTHTARRSGATNMYKAGIPSLSIMKITGHRTEKAFLKYIKISAEENAEMLAQHPFFRK